MATRQELVDRTLKFYSSGGRPGMSSSGICAYFASENERCAIGCLLTAEEAGQLENLGTAPLEDFIYCEEIYNEDGEATYSDVVTSHGALPEHLKTALINLIPTDCPSKARGIEFLEMLQASHDMAVVDPDKTSADNERDVMEYFLGQYLYELKDRFGNSIKLPELSQLTQQEKS